MVNAYLHLAYHTLNVQMCSIKVMILMKIKKNIEIKGTKEKREKKRKNVIVLNRKLDVNVTYSTRRLT